MHRFVDTITQYNQFFFETPAKATTYSMTTINTHKKMTKVLMLGWEFPPILNGGLGVACHGLCNQLKELANITLIVPKSDPNYTLDKLELLGMNHRGNKRSFNQRHSEINYQDTSYVDTYLSPYQSITHENIKVNTLHKENTTTNSKQISKNIATKEFSLYNNNIYENVKAFRNGALAIANDKNFDVIHAHDWMTFPAGLALKSASKKPLILHVHSLETDRTRLGKGNFTFKIEKDAMENADAILSVSNWTKDNIIKHYNIDKSKIHTVHNGIDFGNGEKLEMLKCYKTVLFLGRITYQKGPETFLEIAKKVLSVSSDVHFVVAGTGDQLPLLINQAIKYKISHRIHFTGFLSPENVGKLLSVADAYVMPSVSEPFGLSALEAAQQQVPCIISKQSGVGEVLHHALKTDYWDVDKTADCILAVLNNKALRNQLVKNASHDLRAVDWKAAAQKTNQIYQQLT